MSAKLVLESLYLPQPVLGANQLTLTLEAERNAGMRTGLFVLDGNSCTLDAWGDRRICTQMAFLPMDVDATLIRLHDPSGRNRAHWELDVQNHTAKQISLILDLEANRASLVVKEDASVVVVPLFPPAPRAMRGLLVPAYELSAKAYRGEDGVIEVSIMGQMPNTCYSSSVVDFFPGGQIAYVVDPGSAQVFLDISSRDVTSHCLMMLLPFFEHVSIPDTQHNTVEVYINDGLRLTVDVEARPAEREVVAVVGITGAFVPGTCSVVLAGTPTHHPYMRVFGPNTEVACLQWIDANCG